MARVTVEREQPIPQPEPAIKKIILELTPEEAEVIYGLVGSFSVQDFNTRMSQKNRRVRIDLRDRRIFEIYSALNTYAKDHYNFL